MCKLAGWTGAPNAPLNRAHANAGLIAAHGIIKRTERDGFGFAQHSSKGLRSRYAEPTDFRSMDGLTDLFKRAGGAAKAFSAANRSGHAGAYSTEGGMIVHGRTATCAVTLDNVHPFRRKGWTMAHNGVVNWDGPKPEAGADAPHDSITCDSQHILIALADHKTTAERKAALRHITGYAAFLALSPKGDLIAAVDDTAKLFAGVTSKGRWVFGTTAEIVESIAEAWRSKSVTAYQLDAHTWLEFKAAGGEPELSEWSHKAAGARELGFASRSLGSGWEGRRSHRSRTHYGSGYGAQAAAWPSTGYGEGRFLTAHEAKAAEQEAAEQELAAQSVNLDWEGGSY